MFTPFNVFLIVVVVLLPLSLHFLMWKIELRKMGKWTGTITVHYGNNPASSCHTFCSSDVNDVNIRIPENATINSIILVGACPGSLPMIMSAVRYSAVCRQTDLAYFMRQAKLGTEMVFSDTITRPDNSREIPAFFELSILTDLKGMGSFHTFRFMWEKESVAVLIS